MPEYQVVVHYTSKRTFTVNDEDPNSAAVRAMRQLKSDDTEAGPVGYVVYSAGEVVAEQRAWGAKRKRNKT